MAHVFQTVNYPATLAKAETLARGRVHVLELVTAARAESAAAGLARKQKRKADKARDASKADAAKANAARARHKSEVLTLQAVEAAGGAPVYHPRWRFAYTTWDGRRKIGSGTTVKGETEKLAYAAQSREDSIRRGDRSAPKPSDKPRPLAEVEAKYVAWGRQQGGRGGRPWAPRHVSTKEQRLKFWLDRFQGATLKAVTLPKVEAALQELAKTGLPGRHQKPRPLAGKSLDGYAGELHSLLLWAKRRGYLEADPLEYMAGQDTTPKTRRRALTPSEIGRLLAAIDDPTFRLAAEVALCTGYRVGELRALKVSDLDAAGCTLPLAAEFTKGRRAARQPLPAELAAALAESIRGKPADAPLLTLPAHPNRAVYLALDRAGLPRSNPAGKVDFHALRVTYGTLVVDSGANVREAQTLLRHSNPALTMNTYTRTRFDRLQEVAENVGKAVLGRPENLAIAQRKAAGAESLRLVRGYVVEDTGFEPTKEGTSEPANNGTAARQSGPIIQQAGIVQGDARVDACASRPAPGTTGNGVGPSADIAIAQRKDAPDALPPDLRAVAEAWPRLPDAVRAGILAMVKASGGQP